MAADARHLSLVPTEPAPDRTEPLHERAEARPAQSSWETDPHAEQADRRVTTKQATALTFWIRAARPEWSIRGIMEALEEFRHMDHLELGIAAMAAAQDPETRTPARMAHAGGWWKRAQFVKVMTPPSGIDYTPPCPEHGEEHNEIDCPDRLAKLAQNRPTSGPQSIVFQRARWKAHVKDCQARGVDPGPMPRALIPPDEKETPRA